MQALIDPQASPVTKYLPNSQRVCQIEPDANIFPLAEPLFWTSCPDNAVADEWYYDTTDNTVKPIVA